jgi:hypothetical protein
MRLNGLTFVVCCAIPCLLMCAYDVSAGPATNSGSAPVTVTITVDPSSKHPISPYIYGMNGALRPEYQATGAT